MLLNLVFFALSICPLILKTLAGPTPTDFHLEAPADGKYIHPRDGTNVMVGVNYYQNNRQVDNTNHECARVRPFIEPRPTSKDWQDHGTDQKFEEWLTTHMTNDRTFQSTWGEWAFGNPEWSCDFDGAKGCQIPYCEAFLINDKNDDDLRLAYYVTISLVHLQGYFSGEVEAFEDSGILAALNKDEWANEFVGDDGEKPPKEGPKKGLDETLKVGGILIGLATAIAGVVPGMGAAAYGFAAVTGLLATTVPSLAIHWLEDKTEKEDKTLDGMAKIGKRLGDLFTHVIELLTHANNDLFTGNGTNTGQFKMNFSDYFRNGAMVDFEGIDKLRVIDSMTTTFLGYAINYAWRMQRVFIIGGGPCGYDYGLGFPGGWEAGTFCQENVAWYLYAWNGTTGLDNANGMDFPPGMKQLGKGDYSRIKPQDVIKSSLSAYETARYDFSRDLQNEQLNEAFKTGTGDPGSPSWPGLFTIPVCNVTMYLYYGEDKSKGNKHEVLSKSDRVTNLQWCGPVCGNDRQKTNAFLEAANLKDFDVCSDE